MTMKGKILCIDDDKVILDLVKRYFEVKDFTVLTAENGQVGLELFYKHTPDIFIVDLDMPVIDGFQVLTKVRKKRPNVPIIIISGEGQKEDVIRALNLGAWYYITKPLSDFSFLNHAISESFKRQEIIKLNELYKNSLEQNLGSIIEHFPGFVFTCDTNLSIIYANSFLKKHIGRELEGQYCHNIVLDEKLCSEIFSNHSLIAGNPLCMEIKNSIDGKWYDLCVLPTPNLYNDTLEYQVVMLDISEKMQQLHEAGQQTNLLREKNKRLLVSISDRHNFGEIIGKSAPMQEVYTSILNASESEASVILFGESGTGKDIVARSIHNHSNRKDGPFITVNCGAIPENLIESEFFGYKRGAFSDATMDKYGHLELADGGTLFLDEVGDIPLNMQVKLLRALEGGGFTPLGGTEIKFPNIRIISATNKNLIERIKIGFMRQDFYYRINIIPIQLPPLRHRRGDIRSLLDHFFEKYDPDAKVTLPSEVRKFLLNYYWPGNVREMQNTVQRITTLGKFDFLGEIPEYYNTMNEPDRVLDYYEHESSLTAMVEKAEKQIILVSLESNNWHQGKSSASLQIDRKTLYRKMKQYSIERPPD